MDNFDCKKKKGQHDLFQVFIWFKLSMETKPLLLNFVYGSLKGFHMLKGIGNRELRIRISTYQKSCIVEYTVSDRLKFSLFVLCSLFLLLCGVPYSLFSVSCSFYCVKPLRISTYQKLCISQYTIFDRLKFLFSVLCSLFLLMCGTL